jgi:hypothetical protein
MTNEKLAKDLAVAIAMLIWSAAGAIVLIVTPDIKILATSFDFWWKFLLCAAIQAVWAARTEIVFKRLFNIFRPNG